MLAIVALVLLAGCPSHKETSPMASEMAGEADASTIGQPSASGAIKTATFAAGCFWGVESAFRQVEGVVSTTVGYTGGHVANATYEQVCTGRTGHAESVQVVYDPSKVSYDKLLKVFWSIHDPTTPNRQGPDVGEQYRSVIFYHTPAQETAAKASRDALADSGKFRRPIVTEITPAGPFYRAEEYHQQYNAKHGLPSCHVPVLE